MQERLQKLIAGRGLASRRQAEQWIASGRVLVNGAPVKAMLRSRKKSEFPLSDSNYAADSRLLTVEVNADVNEATTVEFVLAK